MRKDHVNKIKWITVQSTAQIPQVRNVVLSLCDELNLIKADQTLLVTAVSNICRELLRQFPSFQINFKQGKERKEIAVYLDIQAKSDSNNSDNAEPDRILYNLVQNKKLSKSLAIFDKIIPQVKDNLKISLSLRKWEFLQKSNQ